MRRPLDHSERAFRDGVARPHPRRRQRAQQRAAVAPVDMRADVQPPAVGGQADLLHDARVAPAPADAKAGIMRAGGGDFQALQRGDFLAALRVILLDVPCVPVARLVLRVDPELIAAPVQRLAPARLVDEARDRSVGRQLRAQMRIFQHPPGHARGRGWA